MILKGKRIYYVLGAVLVLLLVNTFMGTRNSSTVEEVLNKGHMKKVQLLYQTKVDQGDTLAFYLSVPEEQAVSESKDLAVTDMGYGLLKKNIFGKWVIKQSAEYGSLKAYLADDGFTGEIALSPTMLYGVISDDRIGSINVTYQDGDQQVLTKATIVDTKPIRLWYAPSDERIADRVIKLEAVGQDGKAIATKKVSF
ncbi:hypothetical protein [Paenibacillus sp. CF384]|uniref:hypothetical protein n=1 Tax=Paenibacillus sp. CF384 TaxID=1884382 RepID=UPI000894E92C|nr:hypothetical protein [Paenibacillus sp. CF384]SDX31890.1 hypothetical protein SAMN05518855_101226 [Paenibacillus sp. CF384]